MELRVQVSRGRRCPVRSADCRIHHHGVAPRHAVPDAAGRPSALTLPMVQTEARDRRPGIRLTFQLPGTASTGARRRSSESGGWTKSSRNSNRASIRTTPSRPVSAWCLWCWCASSRTAAGSTDAAPPRLSPEGSARRQVLPRPAYRAGRLRQPPALRTRAERKPTMEDALRTPPERRARLQEPEAEPPAGVTLLPGFPKGRASRRHEHTGVSGHGARIPDGRKSRHAALDGQKGRVGDSGIIRETRQPKTLACQPASSVGGYKLRKNRVLSIRLSLTCVKQGALPRFPT